MPDKSGCYKTSLFHCAILAGLVYRVPEKVFIVRVYVIAPPTCIAEMPNVE